MDVSIDHINEDSSPDTIEQWDSLKHIHLVLALEQEFGVSFSDQQIMDMANLQLVIMILEEIQNQAA